MVIDSLWEVYYINGWDAQMFIVTLVLENFSKWKAYYISIKNKDVLRMPIFYYTVLSLPLRKSLKY